jgi:hypothetical protein
MVRKHVRLAGLIVCFVAGLLLTGVLVAGGVAAETTTAETATQSAEVQTTTVEQTTTLPATTVATTVERTTTQRVFVHPATTTSGANESSSGTPAWVWVLLGILAVGLVVLIVLLARRGSSGGLPAQERQRRLEAAVASWTGQGWALESQTGDSAVLQHSGERMLVSVDAAGHVSTRPLTSG